MFFLWDVRLSYHFWAALLNSSVFRKLFTDFSYDFGCILIHIWSILSIWQLKGVGKKIKLK